MVQQPGRMPGCCAMIEAPVPLRLSRNVFGVLFAFAVISGALVAIGRRDYPNLHLILDTGVCLLSGVMALLLWDMGARTSRPFPTWLALSFTAAFLAELVHVLVTIEWSGPLASIARERTVLRPATWPIAAFILPLGVGCSIWLLVRNRLRAAWFAPALILVAAVLFAVFVSLPRYTPPGVLGITRPTLALVPFLWAGVAWACWRIRKVERMLPALTLMAAVLVLAHGAMLYSSAPHDTVAIIAHLGKLAAFLFLLLSLMEMATSDMLERVRAERELAQLNEDLERRIVHRTAQLRAIFDTALDGLITMGHAGQIVEFNPAAERIFGISRSDAIGRSLADTIIPPAVRGQHVQGLARYLATGEAAVLGKRIEITGQRADGTSVPVELSINRMPGEDPPLFAGFIRDITERKRAEQKLQMQLVRLELFGLITRAIGERQDLPSIFQVVIRSLEDNLPIDFGCVCLYDSAAEVLTVASVGLGSEALALDLGLPEKARIAIDQNGLARCVAGHLVYEPDINQVQFPFPQQLTRGGLRALVAAPLLVESKVFGVLITARRTPHSFSSGECEFLQQLTAHVALAANQAETHGALQLAYDDLRQTQQAIVQQERLRALGQMASGIAHDINNAISPVALYTDSLLEREPQLSAQGREHLQVIQRAIDDVAKTVTRMREFYRHREPQLMLAPIQMNRMVEQVIDLTRARWSDMPQQRGVVIQMQPELTSELPTFMGVESEVREALINLVFNAVDAMPDGGKLTLRTGMAGDDAGVHVEVCDTGSGMDEDTRRRCLEPFFTTKGERGTGLGLAMVYGIVQRHGAEIDIRSVVGQGTSVRLGFRRQIEDAPLVGESVAALPPLPRLRILLVDDDPLLLKSLRDVLEADGHEVTTANGGQEGIDAFGAALQYGAVFAVVISDLGMPYVDGRKVASGIKGLSPSTPVILLTGWGQRLMDEGDVPTHVDHVLSKPPKLNQLREALRNVVTLKDSISDRNQLI